MTYVISRMCRDCVDQACVSVCPVDCIWEHAPGDESVARLPNQLYIEPEICIGCGVCEPECPWEAIFEDEGVPLVFQEDIALNAITVDRPDEFRIPENVERPMPTPGEVDENKRRWGFDPKRAA